MAVGNYHSPFTICNWYGTVVGNLTRIARFVKENYPIQGKNTKITNFLRTCRRDGLRRVLVPAKAEAGAGRSRRKLNLSRT